MLGELNFGILNVTKQLALDQSKVGDLGFGLRLDLLEVLVFLEGVLQFLIQAHELGALLLKLLAVLGRL